MPGGEIGRRNRGMLSWVEKAAVFAGNQLSLRMIRKQREGCAYT